MTNEEVKQILQEIKDDCIHRHDCTTCKWYIHRATDSVTNCAFATIPDRWKLDQVHFGKEEQK